MPIQLPMPPPPGVILPGQPQDPPSLPDVVAARHFQALVNTAVATQAPHAPNADDAARADIYKTSVITAHAGLGAAPAWFQPAMNAVLAPINAVLAVLTPMRQTIGKIRNHQLYDGSSANFEIVPFNDGSMPTAPPHNLPPLLNAAAVRTLTGLQATAYVNGYGLGHFHAVAARRAAIGQAVGCAVAI